MIENLTCAAFFAYTPRPNSDDAKHARESMLALKRDKARTNGTYQSTYLTRLMSQQLEKHNFEFFQSKPVLVPVPKSSPIRPGDLWVPQRIADSMVKEGLGRDVQPCLERHTAVLKSAYSPPSKRPKVRQHYDSFSVEALTDLDDLVLVDDVVTRGATFLGAARRLRERFPNAQIRAFALICTRSSPAEFSTFEDPRVGRITLQGDESYRHLGPHKQSSPSHIPGRTDRQTKLFSA